MSRIAPNLLYLTIYNPTLRPSGPIAPDDEDAEEQAHILFYTSKERAVSRDRMLRQVGLAKALISFSDMFNADDACNNVHSQTRRMIMLSPEPDFWIHAGIEIAKTPRQPADKSKGKGKEKEKAKGDQPLLYDYHEHSVHDVAVQADIMRGYEKFKLRHGSFASILSSLGQEALELQLERFFTVWAWSWNLEDGPEFGEHLGPPLHPMQGVLLPHLDAFSSRLPDEVVAIAISPPYVIPSTRYTALSYPAALPTFLLGLLPPQEAALPPPATTTDDSTLKASAKALPPPPDPPRPRESPKPKIGAEDGNKTFLGMHLDVHLDMPKWNWLTFGKNAKKPPELLAVTPMNEDKGKPDSAAATPMNEDKGDPDATTNTDTGPSAGVLPNMVPVARSWPPLETDIPSAESTTGFEIDRSALEDAMHSERIPLPLALPLSVAPPLPSLAPPVEKGADADADGRSLSETIVPRKEEEQEEAGATDGRWVPQGIPIKERDFAVEEASSAGVNAEADAADGADAPAPVDAEAEAISEAEAIPEPESESDHDRDLPPTPEPEPESDPELPPAEFASTTVHLVSAEDPQTTRRRRLFYLTRDRVLVALIDLADANPLGPDSAELAPLAEDAADLATTLTAAMQEDALAKSVDTLPSATKILQQKDRYALSAARLAVLSPEFKSRSGHLFDARELLRASDPAITEVFSRGQNPQHWHVARRNLQGSSGDSNGSGAKKEDGEEVYMEVFRKEASLTDVDNALAGVIRKSRMAMEPPQVDV